MSTEPSQLNPFYPYQTVGLFGAAATELAQPWWAAWRAQAEPFPSSVQVMYFPHRNDELLAYVREMAGTHADLDTELEAAAIEHLLRDNQADRQ